MKTSRKKLENAFESSDWDISDVQNEHSDHEIYSYVKGSSGVQPVQEEIRQHFYGFYMLNNFTDTI